MFFVMFFFYLMYFTAFKLVILSEFSFEIRAMLKRFLRFWVNNWFI